MTIAEITKQWQTFYSVLGGASATLMGLLFVSLALHSSAIHEEENSHFKRLARLTFSNYLMLIMLSLQMLVPTNSTIQIAIPVAAIAIIGLFWTISLRNSGLDPADANTKFLVRSHRMSLIAYIMLTALAFTVRHMMELALFLMLTPVMLLVVSSVRNSWGLMMMIRTKP